MLYNHSGLRDFTLLNPQKCQESQEIKTLTNLSVPCAGFFQVKHQTWPQRVRGSIKTHSVYSPSVQTGIKKQESTQSPDVRIFLFNLKQLPQCHSQPFSSQTNTLQKVNSASSKQLWMVQSKPGQTLPGYNSKTTEERAEIRHQSQPLR